MKMVCKGCGESRKGVRSHIIPESFFRVIRDNDYTLKIISTQPGEYSKKAPIGVYDSGILCKNCEDLFSKLDDYGAKILISRKELKPLFSNNSTVGFMLNGVDYRLLKLFFISILWRASVSNMPFFKKVKLGTLEHEAKRLIWSGDSGGEHTFSFVLAKFTGDSSFNKAMLDPYPRRVAGTLYYLFYLAGYVLYIKASSNPTPRVFRKFISNSDELIIVNRGDLLESEEFDVLKQGNV